MQPAYKRNTYCTTVHIQTTLFQKSILVFVPVCMNRNVCCQLYLWANLSLNIRRKRFVFYSKQSYLLCVWFSVFMCVCLKVTLRALVRPGCIYDADSFTLRTLKKVLYVCLCFLYLLFFILYLCLSWCKHDNPLHYRHFHVCRRQLYFTEHHKTQWAVIFLTMVWVFRVT